MVTARLNRWTIGEIDPLMIARNDVDIYAAALEKARNITLLPEGGARRRPGSVRIDNVAKKITRILNPTIATPNGGTTTNINNFVDTTLTTTTDIGTLNPYVVVQYDLGAITNISFIDLIGFSLSVGTTNNFYVQASDDNISWDTIYDLQTVSTVPQTKRITVFESYRYIRVARIGATAIAAKVNLKHLHVWQQSNDYGQARIIEFKYNINQSYILVMTDKNMAVYKNRVFQADVSTVTDDDTSYDETKLATLNWCRQEDTLVLFHEDVVPHKITRNTDTKWTVTKIDFDYIPKYDYSRTVDKPNATITPDGLSGKINIASSAAIFTAADIGQVIEGNGGRCRITTFTSTTSVGAIVEIPFYNLTGITVNNWEIQRGWEDAWSNNRGWPRSGVFYQERLWYGGSKSRPYTLWGSVLEDYFNLDPGSFRDTDAFDRDLESNDPIINMMAHQTLQIFTIGGEAAAVQSRGTAITPNTPGFMPQTNRGSAVGLRPVVSDNVILFVQFGGKSISQLLFSEEQQAFASTNVSLYSSHLIKSPVDFNLKRSTNTEESNYLFIVNADGTMAVSSLLQEQNVKGFSLWTTNGLYKNIGVDYEDVYLIVERQINGVTRQYLEVLDYSYLMDCSTKYSFNAPTTVLDGLARFNGMEVNVMADTYNLPNKTVVGGQIILDNPATSSAEVGLSFNTLLKTLPFENLLLVGETIGTPKRIQEAFVWLYNTGEIFVNDYLISLKDFGGVGISPLDQQNILRNGIYRIAGLDGWDDYGQITITQQNPQPLTLLAIGMKVTV